MLEKPQASKTTKVSQEERPSLILDVNNEGNENMVPRLKLKQVN